MTSMLTEGKFFADVEGTPIVVLVHAVSGYAGGFRVSVERWGERTLAAKCWGSDSVAPTADEFLDLAMVLIEVMRGETSLRPFRKEGSQDRTPRCSRCGRILTNAESIAAGIGPECSAAVTMRRAA